MENFAPQIKPTFEAIVLEIGRFSDEDFNKVPFKGSWTPGQVCQHVKLSVQGMPGLWQGNVVTPDRKPDAHVKMLADVFLDFSTKLDSPDFILPEAKKYSQEEFVRFFTDFAKKLQPLAETLDMGQLCVGFEFPNSGPLTRQELLAFLLFHTQRHTNQLKKIATVFDEKTPA